MKMTKLVSGGALRRGLVLCAAVAMAGVARAEDIQADFEDAEALAKWEIQGDAAIDNTQARAGNALRIGPGASVTLKLRDTDGAGEVKIWVYDDGTTPADPKASRATAHWGVRDAGGRILAVGPFCAKYLGGNEFYATGEYTPAKKQSPLWKVQHLGLKRQAQWREWTFRFDPDAGLTILADGKDVNAARKRFDWQKSEVGGFAAVVIFGDKKDDTAQTIWIDDVSATLGGAMNVKPGVAEAPAPAAE